MARKLPQGENWELTELEIELFCPACESEMVQNPNSLTLARDYTWAAMECGDCGHISKWEWTLDTFIPKEVPHGIDLSPPEDVASH